MKTPIILFFSYSLCLFSIPATCFSQAYSYQQIPTKNASWKMAYVDRYPGGAVTPPLSICSPEEYRFTGKDTSIGAMQYYELEARIAFKKFNSEKDCIDNSYNAPLFYKVVGHLWLSQSGKKVFISDAIPADTTKDIVLYFELFQKVGDTVTLPKYSVVKQIDTISINNTLRKRVVVQNLIIPAIDTIVEGVGSYMFGLVFPHTAPSVTAKLVCFSNAGYTEYSYNNSACVDFWPDNIKDQKTVESIMLAPNPFNNELYITSKENVNVHIYNAMGQLIYSAENEQREVRINTISWSAGAYFINVSTGDENLTKTVVKY